MHADLISLVFSYVNINLKQNNKLNFKNNILGIPI